MYVYFTKKITIITNIREKTCRKVKNKVKKLKFKFTN